VGVDGVVFPIAEQLKQKTRMFFSMQAFRLDSKLVVYMTLMHLKPTP